MNVHCYRHTPFGAVIVVSLLLSAVLFASLGRMTGLTLLVAIGPTLLALFLVLFYALTVEIDATHLRFRFGIGLIRQRIPLAEIVDVQPVRNHGRYGWGIHRTPHGGLYNVSGWEALEIPLASDKRFRLGMDEPKRLVQAIEAAKRSG